VPTASEFMAAARRYEEAAQALRRAGRRPEASFGSRVMWGGRFSADVGDFVAELRSRSGVDAAGFESLAAECRRRAGVVEQASSAWDSYDAEFASYERQVEAYNNGDSDVEPTAPSQPASSPVWAEL